MREQHETRTPAEVYEERFVPALFQQWAPTIADAAGVGPGQRVADIACGTGVLARAAAERVGPEGAVTGLDPNEEMLAVARQTSSDVQWRPGQAEALPFPDESLDAAISQFGFMFFEDQPTALREMMRVLRPGGRMAVAVCDAIDHSPGYAVFTELLHRLFGEDVAQAFRAPFSCGDREQLHDLCEEAQVPGARVQRREGTVRFGSVEDLVATERACAWTLGGALDDAQFARLLHAAEESLAPFVTSDGRVEFGMPALLVTAVRV